MLKTPTWVTAGCLSVRLSCPSRAFHSQAGHRLAPARGSSLLPSFPPSFLPFSSFPFAPGPGGVLRAGSRPVSRGCRGPACCCSCSCGCARHWPRAPAGPSGSGTCGAETGHAAGLHPSPVRGDPSLGLDWGRWVVPTRCR